jgi:hypothetical protein
MVEKEKEKLVSKVNEVENDILNWNHTLKNSPDYFLSDTFFTQKEFLSYYPPYPFHGTREDSASLRYEWLRQQKDCGLYYILCVILLTNNNKYIQIIINIYIYI